MTEPARCHGCKRRLKHPSPSGYGPVCERRVNGSPARIRTTSSVDQMPGQEEIDLHDHQPTLWSI